MDDRRTLALLLPDLMAKLGKHMAERLREELDSGNETVLRDTGMFMELVVQAPPDAGEACTSEEVEEAQVFGAGNPQTFGAGEKFELRILLSSLLNTNEERRNVVEQVPTTCAPPVKSEILVSSPFAVRI